MKKIFTPRFIFITTAILIAAASRLFPHIPNFTPIAAIALFGAASFNDKRLAFIMPLAAMIISDIAMEFAYGWGFHNTIAYVYTAFVLTSIIGLYVRSNTTVATVLAGSVISSILFFIITNFGVWAASGGLGGAAGLGATYVLGIPFFAPTALGDLFFNTILFGSLYLAQSRIPALVKVKS
jgi:hypothetical protein